MRRVLPGVAVALAAFAAVLAIVTFATHRDASATAPTPVTPAPDPQIVDQHVSAADVATVLTFESVPDDAAVKKGLGLTADENVTSLQGQHVTADHGLGLAMQAAMMGTPDTFYVEVVRSGKPVLLRVHVDGNLLALVEQKMASRYGAPPAPPPPPPDPRLAGITKIDDAHFEVPQKLRDALFADPTLWQRTARVVPSIQNGHPNGLKLYAIRPDSLPAQLGFQNGDTVQAINLMAITTVDDVLSIVPRADKLVVDLTRRGRPLTLTITITP